MSHVRKQVISIFLTSKCNLKCKYCYTLKSINLKKEHQTIDLDFVKVGLQDFFREYPSRHIRFYGSGEPTQEFELLREITEYAHTLVGDSLTVELQSNGVFPPKVAEWVANNAKIIWISADGPKDIHNYNRPTKGGGESFEVVTENLKYFVERGRKDNLQVGVRATIVSQDIFRQNEIIDYFHGLGIKYINAHPACITIEENKSDLFDWDPVEFAQTFLDAHNRAKELGIYYNTLYITNFDEWTRHFCRANIPYPHLTTDGYVSNCDFAQFGPEYDSGPLQQLVYGKYIREQGRIIYDEEKIYKIRLRNSDNLVKGPCKDCSLAYNCCGGCIGQAVVSTGSLMGIHQPNCVVTKYLGERMPLNKGLSPVLHS